MRDSAGCERRVAEAKAADNARGWCVRSLVVHVRRLRPMPVSKKGTSDADSLDSAFLAARWRRTGSWHTGIRYTEEWGAQRRRTFSPARVDGCSDSAGGSPAHGGHACRSGRCNLMDPAGGCNEREPVSRRPQPPLTDPDERDARRRHNGYPRDCGAAGRGVVSRAYKRNGRGCRYANLFIHNLLTFWVFPSA